MLASIVTVLLAGGVVAMCAGVGHSLLERLGFRSAGQAETLALSTGVGLAVLVLLLALLGFLRLFYPVSGWVLLMVGLVTAWAGLRALMSQSGLSVRDWWCSMTREVHVLFVIGGAYCLVYLLTSLAPPLEGDSLAGYLVLPRAYARQHAIVVPDYAYGWWFPQNMPMLATLGYLLQGETLAMTLVSFCMGLLSLVTVYALGVRHLGRPAAMIGAAAFYGMWSVAYINGSGKVDLGWAFFDLLGLLAFSIWYFERDIPLRWLSLAGLFLGAALGTKNTALFSILVLPLGIAHRLLWRDRRGLHAVLRALLAFGLPIGLFSFWMLRTYLLTGNPLYPMLHTVFTGQETSAAIETNHASGVLGYFRIWWDMSMGFIAYGMGKPIGPILLAFVPLLYLTRPVNGRVWFILAYCLLTSLLWYSGLQRARHFFPGLGLLSLVAGYVLMTLLNRCPPLGRLAVGLTALYLVFNLALIGRINLLAPARLPYILGLESREQFLADHLPAEGIYPSYSIVRYIQQYLSPEARIVALLNGNSYYVERPYYHSGYFAGGIVHSTDEVGDVLRALEQNRITHVLINQVLVDRYRADPRGPYVGSWLDDPAFETQHMTRIFCDGPQCLYALHDLTVTRRSSISERLTP